MPAVLIATDIFHMGVFGGGARVAYPKSFDAEGDRDGLFLVLQPIILTGTGPIGQLTEATWRYRHLRDYFGTPPVLGGPSAPAIMASGDALSGPGWPSGPEWLAAGVPVAFPPRTQFDLELAITYEGDANPTIWRYGGAIPDYSTAARPLVGDPGLAAAAADWPKLAIHSFIRPTIGDYAHLSSDPQGPVGDQQAQVRDWLIGAIAQLRPEEGVTQTTPPRTAHQTRIRTQFILPDPVFRPDIGDEPDEARVLRWRERLRTQPALARDLYNAFRAWDPDSTPGTTDRVHFDPLTFKYGPAQLPPVDVLFQGTGQPVVQGSYHHLLWKGIAEQVKDGIDATDAEVGKSLARLFGLGERLRWPQAAQALSPDRFMVLDGVSSRLPDAIGTNAQSLAGQVFRIGDLARSVAQVRVNRFQINGVDPVWKPTQQATPDGPQEPHRARLAQGIVEFSARVKTHAGQAFEVALKQDPTNPAGLVQYQPKLAKLLEEPLGQGLELPRSLLDSAEAQGRTEMPWGGSQLVVEHPQRIGLTREELLGGDKLPTPQQGVFRLRVRLVRRPRLGAGQSPAGGSAATYVYDIAIAEALAGIEKSLVDAVFTTATGRSLSLWLPQVNATAATIPLADPLVQLAADAAHPLPILRVVDGTAIDAIDQALRSLPPALESDRGFAVHLAIGALAAGDPFNVVPTNAVNGRDMVGLNTRFTLQVGQSADLLAARFEASFDPPPDLGDPVLAHFKNFSKLRVATQFGPKWTLLTYPDALAPLKTPLDGPDYPGGPIPDPVGDPLRAGRTPQNGEPVYSFALIHQFDRELDDGAAGQGDTERTSEASRYGFVIAPDAQGRFGGYIEHQYSLRLTLAEAPTAAFPIEHPVNNCAELRSELHTPGANAADPGTRRTVSLLGYVCDLRAQTITLSLDAGYLKQLFKDAWTGDERKSLEAYRAVYQAFADLRISLAATELELRVEGWAFDNRLGGPVDAEAPDFLRVMRPVGRGEAKISDLADLRRDLTVAIDKVIAADFGGFKDLVGRLVSGADDFPVLQPVPLGDAAWSWKDGAGQPFDPAGLATLAHVLRAGLRVARPANAVVPPAAAGGRYLALPLSEELRDQSLWVPAPETTGFEHLAAAARAELTGRLAPGSELFERASWMVCRSRLRPPGPPDSFEATLQVHFGEAATLLFVPPGKMPAIAVVADLYYAPHGFLPLARHADLPDSLVTLEFAFWLVGLIQAIIDGTPFPALEFDHPVSAKDAEAERQAVEDLVGMAGGIAAQICALIRRVDDPKAIDPLGRDSLYQKVNGLLSQIDDEKPTCPLRTALQARFVARPKDFADLRGLGVVLFDPKRECPGLYSLRINKRVREDLAAPLNKGAPRNDADDFHHTAIVRGAGPRFLLDGLDEATYDAEFTIEQNRYLDLGSNTIIPDHTEVRRLGELRVLGTQTKVALRGDAQARTAEDVVEAGLDPSDPRGYDPDEPIESWSQDPPAPTARKRQLEVNVVHFNPSWRVLKKGFVTAWQYLLPSRRPPTQPVVLVPRTTLDAAAPVDPRNSTVRIGPDEDPMLPGLFAPRLAEALRQRGRVSVDLEGGKPGAAGLLLETIPGYTFVQGDPQRTRGWQRYDTDLTHHYFLVEADPDAGPDSVTQDDAILIETTAEDDPPKPPRAEPPPDGLQTTSLFQWFWYDRMRRTPGAEVSRPDKKPSLTQAVDEIHRAFDVDRQTHAVVGHSILTAAEPVSGYGKATAFLPDPHGGSHLVSDPPAGDATGCVVAAEILRIKSDPPEKVARYAIRVTTLETPFRRTRVRLRVLRNYRDVGGDLVNDIAQAFQMTSPFSEWSERSDRCVRLRTADFIAMRAQRGWILETQVTLADWLGIDISKPPGDPSLLRDFGPVLETVIRETTPRNPSCRLWGPEAEEAKWRLHGAVQDVGRDAHVILGAVGLDRSERIQRQFLVAASGVGPVDWPRVGELTAALDRQKIVSARFEITVIWADVSGRSVMELTLPMKFAR